jgi:hypothetical protein
MTEQEEKLISIEYLLDLLGNREDFDYSKFNQISINAWTKYENELKEAYEKGVKYTDGIISDERFPF